MVDVVLVTGVGPGTGKAIVERFASAGYVVAMLARTEQRLIEIQETLPNTHAFVCDVANEAELTRTLHAVRTNLGAPKFVIHNAVGAERGTYAEVDADKMRHAFEINTMALLALAKQLLPDMEDAGGGALICTGNTSAYRGRARFAGFAPTKAAQRILLESIAREAGPKGVHAAYVAIDAVIDLAWTREFFADKPDEFFCQPTDIADEVFRIAHQPRSAWSFQSVIRPHGEVW
ncbi:MAG: SDR family NAD(P)-dependent oxidoreductase [Gammaproteobacteria bacterium]|nr:SDR family NAD(P)-dependent oxidoreductase [Gammaproteobacteria bacterium]